MSWKKSAGGIQRIFVDNMAKYTSDLQKVVQIILDADDEENGQSLLIDGYTAPKTFTRSSVERRYRPTLRLGSSCNSRGISKVCKSTIWSPTRHALVG